MFGGYKFVAKQNYQPIKYNEAQTEPFSFNYFDYYKVNTHNQKNPFLLQLKLNSLFFYHSLILLLNFLVIKAQSKSMHCLI